MLQDAELHLQRIEDLVPLENRVKIGKQNVEEARRLLHKQTMDVEAAEVRWKTALRSIGLPESLEPHQLKEVSQRSERIAGIHTRLEQFQAELIERNKELSSVTGRIDQLLTEIGIEYDSTDPRRAIAAVKDGDYRTAAVGRQAERVDWQIPRPANANQQTEARAGLIVGPQTTALAIVGAHDEEQYRQFALQHEQLKKLNEKRRQMNEQIMAALGTKVSPQQIDELLEKNGPSGLERRWERIQADTEQLKQQQSQLQEQRGKISQEIKMLADDRRLDEAKLELHSVLARLARAERDWQILAVSSQVLETLRATYEASGNPKRFAKPLSSWND